ncbi:MAG: hypothetical protein SH819_11215 [Cytophagales bacterium]|nr:hypothetical protein [Cytophagales bacterium]
MRLSRPILALAFASLVLVSSSSFMVGIHRCGGEVKNLALFTKAEGCEQEKQLPPCHRHESPPCCQDVTVVHEHQDFKVDISQLAGSEITATVVIQPVVLLTEIVPVQRAYTTYTHYDPPLRSSDLTVSLQVFLI